MITRVLVVDDHGPWRRHFSSAVQQNSQCRVVGEAADGLEAVRAVERLRPDLVLLDIALPSVSGIEAARRILASRPDVKILFVSEQRSTDIVAAALTTGACGYILKSDAGMELLPALDAVIRGKPFVGARFAGELLGLGRTDVDRAALTACRHELEFCADEPSVHEAYAHAAESALATGGAAIVVADSSRRAAVYRRLCSSGLDVDAAIAEGRYQAVSVNDALAQFMVDDWPDEARFWKAAAALLMPASRAARGERPRVAACGECAPTLWMEGRESAAIRLEQLWAELARALNVEVLCAYSVKPPHDQARQMFQEICEQHSAVRSR